MVWPRSKPVINHFVKPFSQYVCVRALGRTICAYIAAGYIDILYLRIVLLDYVTNNFPSWYIPISNMYPIKMCSHRGVLCTIQMLSNHLYICLIYHNTANIIYYTRSMDECSATFAEIVHARTHDSIECLLYV